MAGPEIVPLTRGRADLLRFWKAGLGPYDGDPRFVVPLFADCAKRWSPRAAFFGHAETQHFVAVRDGRDVGRVAATADRLQDRTYGDRVGLFGWFETEDRRETAHALLDAAAAWLRAKGYASVQGPVSYTLNGIAGLLVRDDRPGPPFVDMPYNPPHYRGHLESWGLAKAKDLLALRFDVPRRTDERLARITRRLVERGRFAIRHVRTDRRGFAADVEAVLAIYNGAWERNWRFVAMTPEEIREQAEAFRPVLVPDLLLFAEQDGRPVAFSLAIPDVNEALRQIRGRLWPAAAVRLWLALRKVRTARQITLGILPEFRRTGLDAALIFETVERARALGVRGGECSWILEDNRPMLQATEQVGAVPYRIYRVFEKSLAPGDPGRT